MARKNFDKKNLVILIEDVLGEPPLNNVKVKTLLDELDKIIGWGSAKKAIHELVTLCDANYKRQLLGRPNFAPMLNRLFLGNPGKFFVLLCNYGN